MVPPDVMLDNGRVHAMIGVLFLDCNGKEHPMPAI
jgi:hypothetical protein